MRTSAMGSLSPSTLVVLLLCSLPPSHSLRSVNVDLGESTSDDRHMTSGLHSVRSVYCRDCGAELGWLLQCVRAADRDNENKQGKFIYAHRAAHR